MNKICQFSLSPEGTFSGFVLTRLKDQSLKKLATEVEDTLEALKEFVTEI